MGCNSGPHKPAYCFAPRWVIVDPWPHFLAYWSPCVIFKAVISAVLCVLNYQHGKTGFSSCKKPELEGEHKLVTQHMWPLPTGWVTPLLSGLLADQRPWHVFLLLLLLCVWVCVKLYINRPDFQVFTFEGCTLVTVRNDSILSPAASLPLHMWCSMNSFFWKSIGQLPWDVAEVAECLAIIQRVLGLIPNTT